MATTANYGCGPGEKQSAAPKAEFVTTKACAGCHAKEFAAWRGSDHDRAMQEASEQTVLGNFADAKFSYGGITSTFFKRDGKFFVNTDGPDGKLADYEIKYTFGVSPLQQYLIQFPAGRMQALGIACDSRPKERGGQRWFHLYPKERITHKDSLHWTGIDQNWNYQCAECHSTNLKKRYSDEPLEEAGDGVVKYKSAHIDGVASEKIVRSSHSVQGNPETIREVKRILLEHLAAL